MIAMEFVLFFIAFVLAAASYVLRNRKLPPGPYDWPLVGNSKSVGRLSRKLGGLHKAMYELSRRYETPLVRLSTGGGNTMYVASGLECIHEVLTSEIYDGRPWNYFIELRNMGNKKGITMNDGESWKEIRGWFVKSLRSVGFARREMSESILEELGQMVRELGDGGVRQIKPVIVPAIINVLWTFATGKRFNREKLPYFIELMERRAQAFDMSGGTLAAYPWLRHIAPEWTGYNILVTVNNEFKAILMETIEEHKRNYVPGSQADLIDMFLNEMYNGKGPQAGFDEAQLLNILIDVLLAGLNITQTTLEFLFLNILINQEAQKKLHEEIDRVMGRERLPHASDRAQMPYTEAIIMESQRLVPVLPIIGPRRVTSDTKLCGYELARDSTILINLHSIHGDPEVYPEPDKFKPERFLEDNGRLHYDYLLYFGKGKRQCPGISLAKTSLFLIFTGVMQRYKLLPVPGQDPPSLRIKVGLSQSPKLFEALVVPRND